MKTALTFEVQVTVDENADTDALERELLAVAKKYGTDVDVTEVNSEDLDEE